MMVNGRISEKSVKTYRYLYGILEDMLGSVSRFCMQSTIDAEYIAHLGADKRKIIVTGNTKFDQTYAEVTQEDLLRYKEELGLAASFPVIVAGSTHPTEERQLFEAFSEVRRTTRMRGLSLHPVKSAGPRKSPGLADSSASRPDCAPSCWHLRVSGRNIPCC